MTVSAPSWPRARLGQLLKIKHGFAFKGEHFSDDPGEVVLTPGNFAPSGGLVFRPDKDRSYTGKFPAEFRLNSGDLLVVMTDLTQEARILGAPAFVPATPPCLHNQRLGKVIDLDERRLDRRFLYDVMNHSAFRETLKATASGATVRHTSPGRIEAFELRLPPLAVQRRIASILSAYDDLIEVNRRRIALLEEMVRRLFVEWFIHFRVPRSDGTRTSDREKLPPGWRSVPFGSLAEEVRDAVDPGDVDGATPYVGLEHIPRCSTTLCAWGRADEVTSTKLRFQRGDILFGKIRPYFHKVVWAPFAGVSSSDAIIFRSRSREVAGLVLATASGDDFVAHSVQTSNGTKMPRAKPGVLAKYLVPLPPEQLLRQFNTTVTTWVEMAASVNAANVRLAESRDLLLPGLISGELSVAQAERELETAA